MDAPAIVTLDRETKASERPGDHKDELRLWLRLLTCSTLIESEIRTRLREEFKTTLPRFDLMAQLDKSTVGMTVGEVSQRLMVSNGNVTAVVAGLLADGLVDKRPAPQDRRVQVLSLTALGRRTFKAMADRHEGWIAELLGDLEPADRSQLFGLLGQVKASLHRAIARRAEAAKETAP
jgi:DNA-binding MarR family transcriptional regulator